MVDFMIFVCYNEEKTEGGYDMCKMVPFEGDKQVADIKLHHIRNIVDQASAAKNINRIMLFGSATEERCSDSSDIDIAVFGNMTKSSYLKSLSSVLILLRITIFSTSATGSRIVTRF